MASKKKTGSKKTARRKPAKAKQTRKSTAKTKTTTKKRSAAKTMSLSSTRFVAAVRAQDLESQPLGTCNFTDKFGENQSVPGVTKTWCDAQGGTFDQD